MSIFLGNYVQMSIYQHYDLQVQFLCLPNTTTTSGNNGWLVLTEYFHKVPSYFANQYQYCPSGLLLLGYFRFVDLPCLVALNMLQAFPRS